MSAAIAVIAFVAEGHRFGADRAVATVALVVAAFAVLGRLTVFVLGTRSFRDLLAGGGVAPPW